VPCRSNGHAIPMSSAVTSAGGRPFTRSTAASSAGSLFCPHSAILSDALAERCERRAFRAVWTRADEASSWQRLQAGQGCPRLRKRRRGIISVPDAAIGAVNVPLPPTDEPEGVADTPVPTRAGPRGGRAGVPPRGHVGVPGLPWAPRVRAVGEGVGGACSRPQNGHPQTTGHQHSRC